MGPLSGNVSVYGQAVVNGATLYLKQVNANGGINGKQIEILTEDEQGDATQAVNCFTKMVRRGHDRSDRRCYHHPDSGSRC